MKPTTGIVIGLILFAIAWLDSLPTPPCKPVKPTSETEQQTASPKNSCPTSIGFEITKIRASIHNNRDDITAVSTFAIAVFTIILGVFTVRLAKSNRIAANAADLNARAAIAIELPIIQIAADKVGFGTATENDRRFDYFWVSELIFSNLGRTKAFPIEIQCGWTEGGSLPKVPRYTYTKQFQIGVIFEPNTPNPSQFNYTDLLFESDLGFYNRVREKKVRLWFYCSLVYLDFMQSRHEAGFCWERIESFGAGILSPDSTPAYNRKT
jgi:hypothetical protein